MNTTNETTIKTATTKELAAMYGVSTKTFRTWLQPHQSALGERKSRYYTARQIRIIFEKLGEP
jgi:transposase